MHNANKTEKQIDKNICKKKELHIALAGNPNSGKTTLFNCLTGSRQYVGNWPGVTVEKKEGKAKYKGQDLIITDLPGIYALSPYTQEEIISRNALITGKPDLIINIIDSTNLERNLYLTTQLRELGVPMVMALNMTDVLEKRGDKLSISYLEQGFGMSAVPISAYKNKGIDTLMDEVVLLLQGKRNNTYKSVYSPLVGSVLTRIEQTITSSGANKEFLHYRAVKLFEGDLSTWADQMLTERQKKYTEFYISEIETTKYIDREMIIADERYKYVCRICEKALEKKHEVTHQTITDKIDRIVTHKLLALPVFLLIMFAVFFLTFGSVGNAVSSAFTFIIENIFTPWVSTVLTAANAVDWSKSLVIDGVIAGVGAALSFLPQIAVLFFLLSVLEDTGYMARAAFIMDKLLRGIGLSGKAFVPMLMGFGCTVPAVLATRTLENKKEKRLTMLIAPFMSCSAKMPVYLLMISMFFKQEGPLVIFCIYLLGIGAAVLTAALFNKTLLKGKNAPFVLELPPYRIPSPKSLLLHVWERIKDFLTRAGTILIGATIIIWAMQSFNLKLQFVEDSTQSILAAVGAFIAPAFTLCGFGNWKAAVSLLSGIIAKESVVSTIAVLFNGDVKAITTVFTPASAFSFLVFVLLYTPCIAAVSAIAKEMNSRKWTALAIAYQLAVAWGASALVYQVGNFATKILC